MPVVIVACWRICCPVRAVWVAVSVDVDLVRWASGARRIVCCSIGAGNVVARLRIISCRAILVCAVHNAGSIIDSGGCGRDRGYQN